MNAIDIRLIQRIPTVPFNWHVRSEDESSESDFIRSSRRQKRNLADLRFSYHHLTYISY